MILFTAQIIVEGLKDCENAKFWSALPRFYI